MDLCQEIQRFLLEKCNDGVVEQHEILVNPIFQYENTKVHDQLSHGLDNKSHAP